MPKKVWVIAAACSVIPDFDVIGSRFGVSYNDFWGHRGFTHSLLFAALLAIGALSVSFRHGSPEISRFAVAVYLLLATASHGFLDAMTNGGLGVAFFSPFDNGRYFLPWRPIRVSPIDLGRFFTARGYLILQNEFLWIWLPAAMFAVLMWALRRRTRVGIASKSDQPLVSR